MLLIRHTLGVAAHREFVCSTLCTRWRDLFSNLQGRVAIQTSTIYSNSSSSVSSFVRHNINSVMYRKEEASDLLNNKLERKSRTEFVNNRES